MLKTAKTHLAIWNSHLFLLLLLAGSFVASAQFQNGSNMSFGKNRIQYKKAQRVWSFYRTDIADIHYYPQTKALADFTAQHLPNILEEMETKVGFQLAHKMQIIIYARQSDFEQSNIGLDNDNFYNTGGISAIYGHKVFLYYKGNMPDFYTDLKKGVCRLLLESCFAGSSIGSNMGAGYISPLPIWFSEGLSAYLSQPWTVAIETQIREESNNSHYEKLHFLPVKNQIIAGMSWWKFIADTYGTSSVSSLAYYSARFRNYEKGCKIVFGKPYKEIKTEWINYCQTKFRADSSASTLSSNLIKDKAFTNYLFPRISPNGDMLAYVSNKEGKIRVCLLNLETQKKKNIYFKHYSIEDNPDMSHPIPLWNPSGDFVYLMEEHKDKVYLLPYDINKKKYLDRQVIFINKITSLAFSSDGKRIVLSGVNNGQSDIYVYNLFSRSLEQITNDKQDDIAPSFFLDNQQIIFSSNRSNDTLGNDSQYNTNAFDLFVYNYATKDKLLIRVSNDSSYSDIFGIETYNKLLTFVKNEQSASTRYVGEFSHVISRIDTGIHYAYQINAFPVEKYATAIGNQSFSKEQNAIFSQIHQDGQWKINKSEFSQNIKPLPQIPLNTTPPIKENSEEQENQKATPKTEKKLRQMRLSDFLSADSTTLDSNYQNMVFKMKPQSQNPNTLIPRNLYTQYYINKTITQLDFSFLNLSYQSFINSTSPIYLNNDVNGLFMIALTDLMEDHRMLGGIRLSMFNIGDMELLYSYETLKKRWDKQFIAYYRTQRYVNTDNNTYFQQKHQTVSFYFLLKYPFDKIQSLRFTFGARYNRFDTKALDIMSLKTKPVHDIWCETRAEYVVDCTRPIEVNIKKGFRSKVFAEFSCTPYNSTTFSAENHFRYMGNIGLDLRHYAQLVPTLIWANRLAGGSSFGNSPLIYYLGGVDNWIFAKFDKDIPIDKNINYAYQTLATNMRGFKQNIRNGNNFAVFNTELRWQFMQTFIKRSIKNNFLRSLQLVGFVDIGTAWSGISPYAKDNPLFVRTISKGESINITIHRQTEPIVCGFGVGLRFMIFNYLIRFDYGWGIENQHINYHQGHLSLNLDF